MNKLLSMSITHTSGFRVRSSAALGGVQAMSHQEEAQRTVFVCRSGGTDGGRVQGHAQQPKRDGLH